MVNATNIHQAYYDALEKIERPRQLSNDEMIELVLSEAGIDAKVEYELGSGHYGTAFELNDGRVAKLTTSLSEGIYAARCLGESELDNVVRIDNVIGVGLNSVAPYFVIVQEMLDTTHSMVEEAQTVISTLWHHCRDIYHPIDEDDMSESLRVALGDSDLSTVEQIQQGLYSHQLLGNLATDVHFENIGVRMTSTGRPEIVIFDQMNQHLEASLQQTLKESLCVDWDDFMPDAKRAQLTEITYPELNQIRARHEQGDNEELDAHNVQTTTFQPM